MLMAIGWHPDVKLPAVPKTAAATSSIPHLPFFGA
jgi:hypothetical protein